MNKEEFETRELKFNKLYDKTKNFGRTQFVREIQMQINDNKRLQQENKQLKKDYAKIVQNNCYTLELEKRIDKAIEYIESYKSDYSPYELSDYNVRKILDILKGDSNE